MVELKYNTRQRDTILRVLKAYKDRHLTAEDLYDRLRQNGCSVGKSTVYRYLEALTDSGSVRKYSIPGLKSACYQLADSGCTEYYHLQCSRCGKVIHIDCNEMRQLIQHFERQHHFKIDMARTVLYGVCADCEEKYV